MSEMDTPNSVDADPDFDLELAALFEQAAPPEHDPVFTDAILAKLDRGESWRVIALGTAGGAGALVAGVQFSRILTLPWDGADFLASSGASFVAVESLATGIFALLALGVAWALPKGSAQTA